MTCNHRTTVIPQIDDYVLNVAAKVIRYSLKYDAIMSKYKCHEQNLILKMYSLSFANYKGNFFVVNYQFIHFIAARNKIDWLQCGLNGYIEGSLE